MFQLLSACAIAASAAVAAVTSATPSTDKLWQEGHDMGRDRGFSSWEAPPAGFLESLPAEIRLEKKRPAGVGKPSVTFSSNPSQVPPVAATVPSPVTQLSPETAAAIDSALFEKKVRVLLLLEEDVVSFHYVSLS